MKGFITFSLLLLSSASMSKSIDFVLTEFPPYCSKSLPHNGMTAYYFNKFANSSGLDINEVIVTYARAIHSLKYNKNSGSLILKNSLPHIKADLHVSDTVTNIRHCFLYLEDNPLIKDKGSISLKSLKRLNVSSTNLNPINHHLKRSGVNFSLLNSYKSGIKMLLANRIDLYAFEYRAYQFFKKKLPEKVKCIDSNFKDELIFVIGKSEENKKVVQKLNAFNKKTTYDSVADYYLKNITNKALD